MEKLIQEYKVLFETWNRFKRADIRDFKKDRAQWLSRSIALSRVRAEIYLKIYKQLKEAQCH